MRMKAINLETLKATAEVVDVWPHLAKVRRA
jgi:hypothetical protein